MVMRVPDVPLPTAGSRFPRVTLIWWREIINATGTETAFYGEHPAFMCRQCRGSNSPDATFCIAMIMREIDATRRPSTWEVNVNAGLLRTWTGSSTLAADIGEGPWADGDGAGHILSGAISQRLARVGHLHPHPPESRRAPSMVGQLRLAHAQREDCQGTGRFRPHSGPLRPARSRSGIGGFHAEANPGGRPALLPNDD